MAKQELQQKPEYYKTLIARLLVQLKENIGSAGGGELVDFWTTTSDEIFEAMKSLTLDDMNGMCVYMTEQATQSVISLLPSMPENTQANQGARLRGLVARLLAVLVYASLQTEGESKATELGFRIPDDLGAKTALGMAIPPHTAAASDAPSATQSNVYVAADAGTPNVSSADPPHAVEAASLHRREGNAEHPSASPPQPTGDRADWPNSQGAVTRTVRALEELPEKATRWQKVRASWPMIKEGLRFIGIMMACFFAVGIAFWVAIRWM